MISQPNLLIYYYYLWCHLLNPIAKLLFMQIYFSSITQGVIAHSPKPEAHNQSVQRQIELELRSWFLWREENRRTWRKTLKATGENQQTTLLTYDTEHQRGSNPGHIGERQALSPLRHPCFPIVLFVYKLKFLNCKWLPSKSFCQSGFHNSNWVKLSSNILNYSDFQKTGRFHPSAPLIKHPV